MTEIALHIARHLPAARGGDVRAFAELVRITQSTVSAIALAVLRDVQQAEDIAQEAYLRVWQKLAELNNPDSFLPWLREITRNLALDTLRRGKARPGDRPANADILDSIASEPEHTEAALERERQIQLLNEAFDQLPAEAREVLALYYREGQSSDKVAELLGLSGAAVRQRLARARARLRADIEQRLGALLVATTPGAAFTLAVGAALTGVSPPAAAAVGFGLGVKGGAKLLLGAGIGAALGLLGGIAGIVFGIRPYLRTSISLEEQAALLRQRRIGILAVVLAVIGLVGSVWLPGWLPAALVYLSFVTFLVWHTQVALPRILSARLNAERAADPAAAGRHRRQRAYGWLGLLGGGLAGATGLLIGLLQSGRIG